ncbi:unnamed protein product [Rhodiola kirilowii]
MASSAPFSLMFLVTLLALLRISTASYFKVGGSDGWTSSKNVNYTNWANSIHFQVGDVLIFTYDNKTENVLRVSPHNYKSCNLTAPVHKWTSGNDTVRLHRAGHQYFISSVDGQCKSKAEIVVQVFDTDSPVTPTPAMPSPSPALSSPPTHSPQVPSPETSAPAPAPKSSAAVTVKASAWLCIVALLIFHSV